jgi:Mn-dependent DtxR family transcriptional regulator
MSKEKTRENFRVFCLLLWLLDKFRTVDWKKIEEEIEYYKALLSLKLEKI